METLTLNDGTILERSNIIEDRELYVYVQNGMTIGNVFNILYDPEKSSEIVYTMNTGTEITYTGYTKLIAVRDEGRGLITAVLRKP